MMWGISQVLAEVTSHPKLPFTPSAWFMVDPSFSPANIVLKVFANSGKVWKASFQDEVGPSAKWDACHVLDIELLP